MVAFLASACANQTDPELRVSPIISENQVGTATKEIAIFFGEDHTQAWDYGRLYAVMVRNLLVHLDTEVQIVNVRDYQPGMLAKFDAALYLATIYDYPLGDDFLQDVYDNQKPFMWLNYNIW